MKLFKDLNENQEAEFRQWARDNYTPFTPIEGIWHPAIQDECAKINSAQQFIAETADPIRDKLESFGIPVGKIEPEAEGEQRIQCPWCQKGWLEKTPPEYKDPAAVVYCADCSSVFKITPLPEVSP